MTTRDYDAFELQMGQALRQIWQDAAEAGRHITPELIAEATTYVKKGETAPRPRSESYVTESTNGTRPLGIDVIVSVARILGRDPESVVAEMLERVRDGRIAPIHRRQRLRRAG